ncbi:DUF1428 domain-containing protein [Bdellovibrio sp. HCB337]|uniref:DUF1428 domain-containing protein n=1 Tax=Bdellovibrio sp. HCB337 TaxID=3394358 RepID=UPI0039A5CC1B
MKNKAGCIRSFVIPVPKKNLNQYKKLAKLAGKLWIEHGALSYIECVGEELEYGKVTSFPRSLKLKKGEVVILGWSTFKSRAQAERVMKKVMSDKRLEPYMDPKKLGFDGMRMYWGGFKPLVQM